MAEIIRRCVFHPYLKGKGPTFTLVLWDTHRRDPPHALGSRCYLGYQLNIVENGKSRMLFTGEDFSPSPMDAVDSDAVVECLMTFLTLQPGDTDSDCFAKYTPDQLEFCEKWAEALDCEVQMRYCDENGNVRERRR